MKTTQSCLPTETHQQLQPFMAIKLNHFKRLRYYLKNRLDPNLRDLERQTLLMRSCELDNQETALKFVNLLLKYKARVDKCDAHGMNVLHKAVCSGHDRVVSRFLEFVGDFNVNAQDFHGNTALMHAVLHKDYVISEELIRLLRKYDLSVDISNSKDITPLMQAAISKQDDIAECLVTVGRASEQARDKHLRKSAEEWGSTPDNHNFPPLILNSYQKNLAQQPIMNPQSQGTYRWPDLKRAYTLYEEELATSYRKGAPPRIKTPPPPSDTSSEKTWRKTVNRMGLKHRRHTIALTESLPANLNSRFTMARRSIPNNNDRRRSLNIFPPDISWQARLVKQNSFRRQSDSHVPSTAPAGINSSSFGDHRPTTIRHSVSVQSLTINDEPNMLQSPGRTRRGSLKIGEMTGFRNSSNVEATLPIFEHEEESVENHDLT